MSTGVVPLGSQPEGDVGSHQEANPGSPQLAVGEQKWGTDQKQNELLKSLVPAPPPKPVPLWSSRKSGQYPRTV